MINSFTNKLAFRQAVSDPRPSGSTGFMDPNTGSSVPDPRFPVVDTFVRKTEKPHIPIEAQMGDAPDLGRTLHPHGVADITGISTTGYVDGGHSVG